jgi:hypothetical protein
MVPIKFLWSYHCNAAMHAPLTFKKSSLFMRTGWYYDNLSFGKYFLAAAGRMSTNLPFTSSASCPKAWRRKLLLKQHICIFKINLTFYFNFNDTWFLRLVSLWPRRWRYHLQWRGQCEAPPQGRQLRAFGIRKNKK